MKDHSKTEQGDRENGDILTAVLRVGVDMLFTQALSAKVAALLALSANQQDEQGRARIVLNGHHPEQEFQAGIRLVTVQGPKLHSPREEQVNFPSALVPPYVRKTASPEITIPLGIFERHLDGRYADGPEALVGQRPAGQPAPAGCLGDDAGREYP